MAQQDNWLSDILKETSEQVRKWPDWLRSDDIKREVHRLRDNKPDLPPEALPEATEMKKPGI
jgi:hypothetical protein